MILGAVRGQVPGRYNRLPGDRYLADIYAMPDDCRRYTQLYLVALAFP